MADDEITKEDVLLDFADYLCVRKRILSTAQKCDYMMLVNSVAELLEWIFIETTPNPSDGGEQEVIVNFDTTNNLLPTIGKLIGPQHAGYDLRFGEYRNACWMYNLYTTEHDVQALNALVGMLYRFPTSKREVKKNTFNGDYREPFNPHQIEKYAKRVRHIPEHVKWGVYLWFGYFCKYLMTGDFYIEGEDVSFVQIFVKKEDNSEKKDESLGMTSVLFTLAESRTFGNVDETDNARLFKVMLKLLNDDMTAKNLSKP